MWGSAEQFAGLLKRRSPLLYQFTKGITTEPGPLPATSLILSVSRTIDRHFFDRSFEGER